MAEPQPLAPSKFSPRPLGPKQLERGRLMDLLEAHAHAKLVMIHAPAGYGKTTLMAQWQGRLAVAGQGTGWVSLDEDDNDAARLVSVLSRALSPRALGNADLLDSINLCLQAHPRFTLFLDEEERITAPDAQHLFEVLLRFSPAEFHLVLGSRNQPQKLAMRLRLRSDFLELSTRELAFRPEEITRFIELRCGVTLDAQGEAYLAQRTEGWAAVLQLAAADLARGESVRALFEHVGAPGSDLLQYLSDEVLARLRSDQLEFLLETSFVDELSAPLCDAITGRDDGESMLLELQQLNLMLQPIDAGRSRFRYHALFADILQRQLRQRHPGRLPVLARRASEWCARMARPESAAEYALLSADPDYLIECVRRCAEQLITRGQFAIAKRWLRAIPRQRLREHPELLIWSAWVDIYTNDFEPAEVTVATLDAVMQDRALPDRQLLTDRVIRSLLAVHRARYEEAMAAAEAAWRLVTPADLRMTAAVSNICALLEQMRGRFGESAQHSDRVLALAGQPKPLWLSYVHGVHLSAMMELSLGNLAGASRALELPERRLAETEPEGESGGNRSQLLALLSGPRALVLYQLNRLEDAEDMLERYEPFLNTMFSPSSRALWHRLRVRLFELRGDRAACEEALRQGSAFAARHRMGWMEDLMQWGRVEQQQRGGDPHRARTLAADLLPRASLRAASAWIVPAEELYGATLSALRHLIHAGETHRALECLPIHISQAERQLRRLRLTSLLLLEALAHRAAGEHVRALQALRRSLQLGSRSGAIRVFLDEGSACRALLQQLGADAGVEADEADYLRQLLGAFEDAAAAEWPVPTGPSAGTAGPLSGAPTAALSARELQILERLAEGHSNLAVGQQLYLSPNTVKWHLSQIYSKLGVRNRTQAVHVARQHQRTRFS